ncbi:SURF1 family protein [Microbacterium sp. NPDC076911]|uniref:SURF1 family cytochrome oxidase biogenesis protein n=1 Tax=Microbacterium sp. NPDC076911 TaxID=3154958 RepID=UPI00343DAC85
MQNLPRAGRWTIYVAIAIVFAIACGFLSYWQFTRNESRAEQLALVEQNYDATPVALGDLVPVGSDLLTEDEWRPVELVGQYLSDEELLVRNRPHGGTAAFEVLVPFETNDGRVVLIDRGWVAPGVDQPDPDVVPAAPTGEVTVVVRLRPSEALPSSGRSAPEGQVPTINVPLVAATINADAGARMDLSVYGLMVSEDPAMATTPAALDKPSEDPGPHLSYAIQWILFAVMGFVFIGYVIRTERQHRREDEEDEAASSGETPKPAAARPPAPRRRDRDSDDEDALIDAIGYRP